MNWQAEAERLAKEVERVTDAFEYHKRESARKSSFISKLSAEIDTLRQNVPRQPEIIAPNRKAWNSLLKLVGGMAIAIYAYDPRDKRSKAVSDIQSDLDLKGVNFDADTIRKRLKEASELPEFAQIFGKTP